MTSKALVERYALLVFLHKALAAVAPGRATRKIKACLEFDYRIERKMELKFFTKGIVVTGDSLAFSLRTSYGSGAREWDGEMKSRRHRRMSVVLLLQQPASYYIT